MDLIKFIRVIKALDVSVELFIKQHVTKKLDVTTINCIILPNVC